MSFADEIYLNIKIATDSQTKIKLKSAIQSVNLWRITNSVLLLQKINS